MRYNRENNAQRWSSMWINKNYVFGVCEEHLRERVQGFLTREPSLFCENEKLNGCIFKPQHFTMKGCSWGSKTQPFHIGRAAVLCLKYSPSLYKGLLFWHKTASLSTHKKNVFFFHFFTLKYIKKFTTGKINKNSRNL